MISIKDFLEAINYKISGGSEYLWDCFGPNARYLDSSDEEGYAATYSASIIFDSLDQTVYKAEVWDYTNDREYRWIHPDFVKKHKKESKKRNVDHTQSIDSRTFIDLDIAEDMLDKISKISSGAEYDPRVQISVDFSDEELLTYMKLAHDRDMTFNQLVEEALLHAVNEFNAGQLTKETAQAFIKANKHED